MTGQSIQHKSLRAEILFVLGRATAPLDGGQIYERCTLAEEVKQVSNSIFQLKDAGKIERVEGNGRAAYRLAKGVAAPAPAGKTGRPEAGVTAPLELVTGIHPAPESGPPALDIPTPDDQGISLQGAAGKTQRAMSEPPEFDIPSQGDQRAKGRAEAAHRAATRATAGLADTDQAILRANAEAAAERVLGKADKHRASRGDESLADAILARLKRQFGESMPRINTDLDITTAPAAITINVQRVEINLSLELGK